MVETTDRADKGSAFADFGPTWRGHHVRIKDNGPGCRGVLIIIIHVRVSVVVVVQRGGNTKVAEENGAVVVDEEVCCLDIPVDEAIDMQIAVDSLRSKKPSERRCLLETLESLPEDAAHDLLFYAARPCILHDVGGTTRVHKAEGDV
jgi:hypothetical protein